MSKEESLQASLKKRLINWANSPCRKNSFWWSKLHTLVRVLLITAIEFKRNALNIRASALTYTILLSLVPMIAMSTAVVKGLGGGKELRHVVYSYINTLEETTPLTHIKPLDTYPNGLQVPQPDTDSAPSQEATRITDHFRSGADQIFAYVDNTDFATLGTIGVLGVLLSALLVLGNIELSMNTIWHIPTGRSLLRKLTDYLTFLILMPLSINFGFAANAVLKNETLLEKLSLFLPGTLIKIALLLFIPLFFITLTLFLIYIFFPNRKVKSGPALIGALCAGTLWFITQNVYIGLQIGVSRYNAIYGSFATLPLFLIWMFLGWVFILGGAQLAFACQQQRYYQIKPLDHSPLEQLSAAFDILNLTYSSYSSKTVLRKKDIPSLCPAYTATLLLSSLNKLLASQILAVTKKDRILPGGPQNNLQYREIISAILGKSFPETEGGKAVSTLFEQVKPLLEKNYSTKKQAIARRPLQTS